MSSLGTILFTGWGAAIIAAILYAFKSLIAKRLTTLEKVDYFIVIISQNLILVLGLLIIGLYTNSFSINLEVICFSFLVALLGTIASFGFLKSISIEDFSLTLPFISLTPLFLIPLEFLFFRQLPSFYAVGGIFLIIIGSFLLSFNYKSKKIIFSKGSIMAIITSFLYAFWGLADKRGISITNLISYLFLSRFFIILNFIIISRLVKHNFFKVRKSISLKETLRFKWHWILVNGSLVAIASWLMISSYQDILVNYAVSLKRAGYLITIILGAVLFKEKNLLKRMPGILAMLGGAILIVLLG